MRKATAILATAATAILFAGCTALPSASDYDLEWLTEFAGPDEGPPVQIVAMWTDASLKQAGSPETRGFGGRIYLYDAKQRAVEADGELIVYAFIEHDRQPPSKHPDRKFVFTAEELKEHYSKTALGHSYSVWLPWDRAGDEAVSVSLLPTFKPADEEAKAVLGAPSLNVLKGKKEREAGLDKMEVSSSSGVRPVSYHEGEKEGAEQVASEGGDADSSRRRVSIYDPQTNVSVGPLPKIDDVTAASFDSELPKASGVSTTTFDLPSSMSLAMRNAPPTSRTYDLSKRQAAANEGPSKSDGPANGTVFDLAGAAKLADAKSEAKLLSKLMGDEALKAGVEPATSRFSKGKNSGEGDEEELKVNRFNSRKRSPPSWDRNRDQRW